MADSIGCMKRTEAKSEAQEGGWAAPNLEATRSPGGGEGPRSNVKEID